MNCKVDEAIIDMLSTEGLPPLIHDYIAGAQTYTASALLVVSENADIYKNAVRIATVTPQTPFFVHTNNDATYIVIAPGGARVWSDSPEGDLGPTLYCEAFIHTRLRDVTRHTLPNIPIKWGGPLNTLDVTVDWDNFLNAGTTPVHYGTIQSALFFPNKTAAANSWIYVDVTAGPNSTIGNATNGSGLYIKGPALLTDIGKGVDNWDSTFFESYSDSGQFLIQSIASGFENLRNLYGAV